VTNFACCRVYDQYSFQVIPVMGQIIAGQWKPYQYLVESIRQFPDQVSGHYNVSSITIT
jgi:2-methoxy-6-polyprenyl-1,4-benzoquinol methylase